MSTAQVEEHGKAEEAKTVTIIVNGRAKAVPKNEEITFIRLSPSRFRTRPPATGSSSPFSTPAARAISRLVPWSRGNPSR